MTTAPVVGRLGWQDAVVERVLHRTSRVASLFLNTTLGAHEAGQHLDVKLTAPDGYVAERSYSIASAPGDRSIELAVERLENGEVSPFLTDDVQPGDTLEVRGPIGGHFIWRAQDGGPLLLIGGGSGVAPLMAILRHRLAVAPDTTTLLAYSARTWEELIFRDELLIAAASDARLNLIVTTTREGRHRPGDYERRFDRESLREILRNWGAIPAHAYVCGSTPFVEAVASALVDNGIGSSVIRTERYGGVA
ncbi:MAG: FAD-binding oxidoreductase [bacterium]